MCNFENILRFLHFSIASDMPRITHFLAEIMNPKNSASGNFLTFSMSAHMLFIYECNVECTTFCLRAGTVVKIFDVSPVVSSFFSNTKSLKLKDAKFLIF